jgi:shikimate dehydrogenase
LIPDSGRRDNVRTSYYGQDDEMSKATRPGYLVGLLGEGIRRSLTPPMHVSEAARLGIDYEYRVLDLLETGEDPGATGDIVRRARDEGFAALNVTHPCKQLVIPALDELSPEAARLDAVNLVLFRGGRMIGHNTDWTGFRSALTDGLPGARRDTVLQVGTGGAGAATAYALLSLGVKHLVLADQNPKRAEVVAEKYRQWFPDQMVSVVDGDALTRSLAAADGVINATPMGMAQHPGVAFDIGGLRPDAWVADIVYVPIETELLRTARAAGHRVLDGGRMAVGQAVDSIRLITGLEPDADRMRARFLELLDTPQPAVGTEAT